MKNTVLLLAIMLGISINAQMKIIITSLPQQTPKETKLYLASSLNQWNPKDENYQFHKNNEGL